jgi:hypothetical protein
LTQYFEEHKSTREPSTYSFAGTFTVLPGTTLTSLSSVIPTVTDPVVITTIVTTDDNNEAVSYHQVVIPSGQAATADPSPFLRETVTHYHYYVSRITTGWTGSCALPTQTVTKWIIVPEAVSGHLSPIDITTTSTSVITGYSPPMTSVFVDAQLNITELPIEFQESVNNEHGWESVRRCHPRDVVDASDDNSNFTGPDDSDDDFSACVYSDYGLGAGYICESGWAHIRGLRVLDAAGVYIGLWAGFIAMIGILQSILRFRKLMIGRQARRGVPAVFALILPPISLLVFCCFPRAHYAARSPEDRVILKKQWNAGSALEKIRLWIRYGFTCGYPAVLGQAPPQMRQRPISTMQAARVAGGNVRGEEHPEEAPPPPYSPPASPTHVSAVPLPDVSVAPLPEVIPGEQPPKYES